MNTSIIERIVPVLCPSVRMFANGPGNWGSISSLVLAKKWFLIPLCLILSIIKYGSRVKWSNPGKGEAPSSTPWCRCY